MASLFLNPNNEGLTIRSPFWVVPGVGAHVGLMPGPSLVCILAPHPPTLGQGFDWEAIWLPQSKVGLFLGSDFVVPPPPFPLSVRRERSSNP